MKHARIALVLVGSGMKDAIEMQNVCLLKSSMGSSIHRRVLKKQCNCLGNVKVLFLITAIGERGRSFP